MKAKYPVYSRTGDIKKIREKLNSKNTKELESFGVYLSKTNKQSKVDKILRLLVQFKDVTEKNLYEKPTKQEIDEFLALLNNSHYRNSYKREIKIYLKKFLRWKWKDLELIDDFGKLDNGESEKVTEKDLMDEGDVKKLISFETDLKWQTLISCLYESGCRPEELLSLKWGCVKFDGELTELSFVTKKKTSIKSRVFPVKASTPYLEQWKNANPNTAKDDFVFPSPQGWKPITVHGLDYHLKNLAKKSGIKKNVFPYLFRFSKLTELYENKNLDDRTVADLAGHSVSMAGRYHKISNKTARENLIREIYKTRQLTKKAQHKLEKRIKELEEWKTRAATLIKSQGETMQETYILTKKLNNALKLNVKM